MRQRSRWGRSPKTAAEMCTRAGPRHAPLVVAMVAACLCFAAPASASIYWVNSNGTIGSANLDGGGVDQSLITAKHASGIAVGGQYLYWSNDSVGTIERAALDGSGVDLSFITGLSSVAALAVSGQYIYWTSGTGRLPAVGALSRRESVNVGEEVESAESGSVPCLGVRTRALDWRWTLA